MKKLLLQAFLLMGFAFSASAQSNWTIASKELVFQTPPFNQCHASTIVETKSGELLLAFFAGTHEGNKDVSIWLTKLDQKNNATKASTASADVTKIVANGKTNKNIVFPTWNPVLFQPQKGPLYLFYKIGPNPREWWGAYKTSNDNGHTWSEPKNLPKGILGPIKNKPVQLSDGTILSPSSIEEENGRWKIHIERSTDNAKTWTFIPIDTTGFDVIQPSILFHGSAVQKGGSRQDNPHTTQKAQPQKGGSKMLPKLQTLSRSKQGTVVQSWSEDGGLTWSKQSKTSLLNPNSGTDAVTLNDGSHIIVYNPDVPGADWYEGRGKLHVALSADGINWKDIAVLENGTKEEYSYPAIIQTQDGKVHITYTYNRKNIKHVVLVRSK